MKRGHLELAAVLAALLAGMLALSRIGTIVIFQAVGARAWGATIFLWSVTAIIMLRVGVVSHAKYMAREPVPVLETWANASLAAISAAFLGHSVWAFWSDPETYVLFWGFFLLDAGMKTALSIYFAAAYLLRCNETKSPQASTQDSGRS